MKTIVTEDGRHHKSDCGQLFTEQESKHFFYVIENTITIGQVDIKGKEFRFSENGLWLSLQQIERLSKFLKEIYEYYNYVN